MSPQTTPQIALATYQQVPDLTADDQQLATALRQHGAVVEGVVWNDPSANWAAYDVVVLRSVWDYHHRPEDFQAWLQHIARQTRLWNPPALVRWNMQKTYLRDLAQQGIHILPTRWFSKGEAVNLANALRASGWPEAVVKPTVAASAYRTWRTTLDDAPQDNARFIAELKQRDLMLQAFVPAIQTHGEWSFIFLGGEYSHAVLKRPAAGDFRVQSEYGGTVQPQEPSAALIEKARAVTACIPDQRWLYARVDAVGLGEDLILMELELIEPALFLDTDSQAADRFAEAILAQVAG